jgi:vancomycin permeability regulator SanA
MTDVRGPSPTAESRGPSPPETTDDTPRDGETTVRPRGRRRLIARAALIVASAAVVLSGTAYGWTRFAAAGHLYDPADAPRVDVAVVLGAQVAPGGAAPMPVLRGRLATAAELVRAGRVKVLLVTGDAGGGSGDETAVMTSYLVNDLGIDPARVVIDPDGLDTYDSCRRARTVFGVTRALVITQAYHLSRAVALCRDAGIDADGVRAGCADCRRVTLLRNMARDYAACTKAAFDALVDRPPGVISPPSRAVTDALDRR